MTNSTETTEVPPAAEAVEETKPKAPATSKPAPPRADKKALDKAVGALQADVEKINEEIAGYDKQIEEIKKKIDAATESRSGQQDEFSKEKAKRDAIKNELDKLKAERDALSNDLDRLKGKVDSALESSKNAKAQMKFRSVEEIDAEIARLNKAQSTTSMSLSEEKKLVKEIEVLRQQKKQLATLGNSQEQIKNDKDERARVNNLLKAKRDEVGECLTRLNAQRDAMSKMMDQNGEGGKKGLIPTLIEERKGLWEKKKAAYDRRNALRDEISAKWDEFKAKRKEYDLWFEEERKVRDAERKARQEEYQKKLEEEELKKVPYEEEMALCDYLCAYLKQTFLTDDSAAKEEPAAPAAAPAGFEHDGMTLQAFKRDDDEEEDWFSGAKGGKKNKQVPGAGVKKNKPKKDTIAHSPECLASFALIKVEAPAKVTAVESTITALKEKKAWFSVQPRPVKAKKEKKEEEGATGENGEVKEGGAQENGEGKKEKKEGGGNEEKKKGGKKVVKEFKSSEEDFPSLGAAPAAPAAKA